MNCLRRSASRSVRASTIITTIFITTIFETMTEALVRGEKVELRGFGSLRIRHRKPRAARNPKTGAAVDVPPKRVLKFKVGQELRRSINVD